MDLMVWKKMMRKDIIKNNYYFIYIIVFLLLNSCSMTYYLLISPSNPTSYNFDIEIEKLHDTMKQNYKKFDYLFYNDIYNDALFEKNNNTTFHSLYTTIFIGSDSISCLRRLSMTKMEWDSSNKYDFYLKCEDDKGSEVYFDKNGNPVIYHVDFVIHLGKLTENQTKVEVKAIDSRIVTGEEILPHLHSLSRPYKHSPVNSSTIEEYRILLKIGELLGVKDQMPQCKYPNKNEFQERIF